MAVTKTKTSFSDCQEVLSIVLRYIDEEIQHIKNRQKNLPVWRGYDNYKAFLTEVEKKSLKSAANELGITLKSVKDMWHVMTLPTPVYSAIENDEISFSKAKYLTAINFDFNNESDAKVAGEIVEEIKSGLAIPEIKDIIEKMSVDVWNQSTVVMSSIMSQQGVSADSRY